jgi:hypothetical protein
MLPVILWKPSAIASHWKLLMIRLKILILPPLIALCCSCKNEHRNTYAIRDFRTSVQPFLLNIVTKGIVTYPDSSDIKSLSDEELICLGKSENPVLRSTAIREMLDRNTFNHFDVVMNHLDDTAIIATDAGEFGICYQTVSDYILQESSWETDEARNKIIERVLTEHNYLQSAYIILLQLEPEEKFYPHIKNMASRPRRLSDDGHELDFNDIEYALYGLAKFKKQGDVKIIIKKMMENFWRLSDVSFRLMKEFPDSAYHEVFRSYHWRQFYKFSGNRPHGFTGFIADLAAPEDFIQALAIQQTHRSARLLDTILIYLPQYTCLPDKETIIEEVILQIWEYPCSAYATLREKIRKQAEEIVKGIIRIAPDPIYLPGDTTRKKFYWRS